MSAGSATLPRTVRGRLVVRGGARRRAVVAVELLITVAICLSGYFLGATWFKEHEATWTVAILRFFGEDRVSDVLPGHILMFRDGEILDGEVTTSCSSILTVIGLTALTFAVLRKRRMHAVLGLAIGLIAVIAANDLRLIASALAGLHWGQPAMVLFHDWVGTVWTLAATLGGFLVMVHFTLPVAERAEQDVAGRHTARRPTTWARPGLGYRAEDQEETVPARSRRSLTSYVHQYLLPRSVSRRLAARREAGRIDYRIGHLPVDQRVGTVRALVADGLGAHIASLLAIATYEEDPDVLDALADAIAARQWEPVTSDRISAVRLWARGWLFSRRLAGASPAGAAPDALPGSAPDDDRAVVRAVGPRPPVPAPVPRPAPAPPQRPHPRSFARPTSHLEDLR